MKNGAVSPDIETLYEPFAPDVAEAVLPLAPMTVTGALMRGLPVATVPVMTFWAADEPPAAPELDPPPHAARVAVASTQSVSFTWPLMHFFFIVLVSRLVIIGVFLRSRPKPPPPRRIFSARVGSRHLLSDSWQIATPQV
jgi:hypothetical protein